MSRKDEGGFSLVEVVLGMAMGSLLLVIVYLLYSQTQRIWILGQTQVGVDTDARRTLTQIERRAVMANAIAAYAAYPYGYVEVQSGYFASSYGYVVPNGQPSAYGYTIPPQGFKGLPYPTPTPVGGAVASTASDVLYIAVPHTAPSPSCANKYDLHYYYADPDDPKLLKQTTYLCYTKAVDPPPVTDIVLAANTGAQVLASSDYNSVRTSVLTDKLDPARGFAVGFPTTSTIDITLRIRQPGLVFGRVVSNTYTTQIYARNL